MYSAVDDDVAGPSRVPGSSPGENHDEIEVVDLNRQGHNGVQFKSRRPRNASIEPFTSDAPETIYISDTEPLSPNPSDELEYGEPHALTTLRRAVPVDLGRRRLIRHIIVPANDPRAVEALRNAGKPKRKRPSVVVVDDPSPPSAQDLNPRAHKGSSPSAPKKAAEPEIATANAEANTSKSARDLINCAVCMDKVRVPTATTCGHIFCRSCIAQAIRVQRKCPVCRKNLTAKSTHPLFL